MFSKFFVLTKLCQNLNIKYYGQLYNPIYNCTKRRLTTNPIKLLTVCQHIVNHNNAYRTKVSQCSFKFTRKMSTIKKEGDGNSHLKKPNNDETIGKEKRDAILRRLKFRRLKISKLKCKRCKNKDLDTKIVPSLTTDDRITKKGLCTCLKLQKNTC